MKRPRLLLAAMMLFLFQHCENQEPVLQNNVPHDQILDEVKEWYEGDLPSGVLNKSMSLKAGFVEFWESSTIQRVGQDNYIVTVPLAKSHANGTSTYQLIAFRDKEKVKGFIVQITPEDKLTLRKDNFSGQVKIRSRKGNQLKSLKFKEGRKLINNTSTMRAMEDEVIWGGELPTVEVCAVSYDDSSDSFLLWLDFHDSGWGQDDWNDWVDDNGVNDFGWLYDDYNLDGYIDVGIPVFDPPTIVINLSNPCLDGVAVNLNNANIPSDINQVINDIFGSNNMTNLILEENTTLNAPARTTVTSESNPFVVTIAFNPSYFSNTSSEYVAATMYHEAMHAYLDANTASRDGLEQHVTMATEYIDWLVDAMSQAYPGTPDKDAKGLALRGLADVMENNPAYWNDLVHSMGFADTQEVINLTDGYRNGTKGSPCPQ